MKALVAQADVEQEVVGFLASLLDGADVGVVLPPAWTPADTPFVLVACDGVLADQWPVATRATVRVTVWAGQRSTAWSIAGQALGNLLTADGDPFRVSQASGAITAFDADSRADLTSFTVRVDIRTVPLPD